MNKEEFSGQWHILKGKAKKAWGKLTDDELDKVEGNFEKMVGLIQKKYGKAREEAEREVRGFMK